jgi:hypothetical protein
MNKSAKTFLISQRAHGKKEEITADSGQTENPPTASQADHT